jgi:hypothetical protein
MISEGGQKPVLRTRKAALWATAERGAPDVPVRRGGVTGESIGLERHAQAHRLNRRDVTGKALPQEPDTIGISTPATVTGSTIGLIA